MLLPCDGGRKLARLSSGREVWESKDAQWRKLPLVAAVSSLSFGLEGTFWVTATDPEDGRPFTGQFDKQGEFLRAYRDEFSPVKVRASNAVEEIAVLETTAPRNVARALAA